MDSISRHPSWLAALALCFVVSTPACVSVAPQGPGADEGEAPVPLQAAEPADDEPEHVPNKLRWTTASEVDNFGFDVYRGDHEDGPFTRLTERPIPGAGTTDLTTHYSLEDNANDPYETYYYYVESISLTGVREQFTPIIRAEPKLTRDGEEGDEDASEVDL